MPRPLDHKTRLEGWMRDALAIRGDVCGYIVAMAKITAPGQLPQLGWTLVVTMRNPLLGQGDLYIPVTVPGLSLDQPIVSRVVSDTLTKLDAAAAETLRQGMHGSNGAKQPPA